MRKITFMFLTIFITITLMTSFAYARVSVRGYTTKSGSYVAPHYRTSPNKTKLDNWATKNNYNPYSGKKGYKSSYKIDKK